MSFENLIDMEVVMSFLESMGQSAAAASLFQTFAQVEKVRTEQIELPLLGPDYKDRGTRGHSEFGLFVLTRYAFIDAFTANSAALVHRVARLPMALILGCFCDEFSSHLEERVAEIAMTVIAIFIAFIGFISPNTAKVMGLSFLGEVLESPEFTSVADEVDFTPVENPTNLWLAQIVKTQSDRALATLRA